MAHKAMTEFCWCGKRYAAGDIVTVDERSAKKLLASRLIFKVADSAVEQDRPSGEVKAPTGNGQEATGNNEPRGKKRDRKKQARLPGNKQVTCSDDK